MIEGQITIEVLSQLDAHFVRGITLTSTPRPGAWHEGQADTEMSGAVMFGLDQGLVSQFSKVVADYAIKTLAALSSKPQAWAVSERVHARLTDAGLLMIGLFTVPNSVKAITPLFGQIQIESEAHNSKGGYTRFYVFHNRPQSGPLDEKLFDVVSGSEALTRP